MVLPLQGVISFCVTPSPRALPLGWEILPPRGVCTNCDVIPFTYYMVGVNKHIDSL